MSFITLILKNLVQQPVRAGLTMLGIAIGITTVVALGVITEGLKASAGQILRAGGADFIVAQEGTADLSFSNVSEDDVAAVRAMPDVESATGALMDIKRVGSSPFFVVMGIRADDLSADPPALLEGRLFAADTLDEILLGSQAAASLGVGLGETLEIAGQAFKIVGIYETGETWLDGGSQAPLATVQMMTRRTGQVTMIYVKVREGADMEALRARIESEHPQLVTVAEVSELQEVDQGILIIDAATLAISALAVVIGAIGVMNTMIMSVFERTREIGILRAVGWSGQRILRMIIGESLLLCAVAMLLGSLLGVLVVIGVSQFETVQAFLEPQYSADVFVRGLIVAVVVAIVGALYPAIRAVRLTPMEALWHE